MHLLGHPITVLLVEDDPGDEMMTLEALGENEAHNTVFVARDGLEALNFLFREPPHAGAPRPDLILLDLNLPKYNGRQILERVKSDPDLCTIPVVVLTTSASEEDVLSSYRLHANAYVTKPVDLPHFLEAIKQIDDFFVRTARLPTL